MRSPSSSILTDYLSRPSRASIRRSREISHRALAYVIGFILTNIFTLAALLNDRYGFCSTPFAIVLLARVFFPLQGLFNILVYTYHHVASYRRSHIECNNWFEAFWNVIKSGGDTDRLIVGRIRSRSDSRRKRQRVLEQSENRRRNDVESTISSDGIDQRERNRLDSVRLNLNSTRLGNLEEEKIPF